MGRSTTITPTRTQTKTINTTITTPTETEEGGTQKEYEALMSDWAKKRAADSQAITDKKQAKAETEVALETCNGPGGDAVQAESGKALPAASELLPQILDSLGNPHTIPAGVMRATSEALARYQAELLASGSSPPPIKRQRIPRTMPLQIVDAHLGTSLSRLRHQLQDESPLYPEGLSSESSGFPEGLSSESSDTVEEVESDTVEEVEEPPDSS